MFNPIQNYKLPFNPQGKFAAKRKHDIHTGIDLYCKDGEAVFAITDCKVLYIEDFTGTNANSPWWNDTQCIIVKCEKSGNYIVYGEVVPTVQEDEYVKAGSLLGNVKRVLKTNKGLPMSMLHLEYYDSSWDKSLETWKLDDNRPDSLMDPTQLLLPNYLTTKNVEAVLSHLVNGTLYYNVKINKDVYQFPVKLSTQIYVSGAGEYRDALIKENKDIMYSPKVSCAMFYSQLMAAAFKNEIVRL